MANKDDYLTEYRCFFENFAQTVNPNDQLPVKLGSYKLINLEVVGGIIDWTSQYLTQKKCPQSLLSPLIKIIIDEVRKACKKNPIICGYNTSDDAYEPLKLMQTVMAITNEICLRYLDNSKLCSLPPPGPPHNAVSSCAIKNNRRRMEDRHIIIHDLHSLFVEEEASPSSYYAIFDGHAGHDAAAYSCAHLHQFLGESKDFISNPEQALRDAFLKTDTLFLDKCKVENFVSGTTAVCALLRHKEKTLYIGWVGDSQAVLVGQGRCRQCVHPHKPSREDEKNRIEKAGGVVIYWGTWRVNGQLAVSRAIGDLDYKPYVTAVPDVVEIPLTGNEDFLILACDGLWDYISEVTAARCVYETILKNPDDIDSVSEHLIQQAKKQDSTDNISVIVVFLRETSKIAAEAHWATRNGLNMDTLDNANATNPFVNSNDPDILPQKEGFVINLADGFKQNGTENSPTNDFLDRATNGKWVAEEFDVDDFGPEDDVDDNYYDECDRVTMKTTIENQLSEETINNNPENVCYPFSNDKEEKAALETDSELQKRQTNEFDSIKAPREETPTPPADSVHETSGLVDNVAESGEDSDDEWNYFKGDQAQKENIPPSQTDKEVCGFTESNQEESDTMSSQLNPNATEFVPMSPKRNTASPAYQALMDDYVIAQSPKRITTNNDIDINIPNAQEFESEIKSRPGSVEEECACNSDEEEKTKNLTSQEIMENLLNGKSIEEIEFQPNSGHTTTHKSSEFHFGPNSTPFASKFLDQSENISTKAVFGDDSTAEDESFENQNTMKDPMSMSFYQDKDDVDDTNPFDLNKIHTLPENIDDFLQKSNETNSLLNDTISDLPEHNPTESKFVEEKPCDTLTISEKELNETNNLLSESPLLESKSPASSDKLLASQSPIPREESPLIASKSPLSREESPLPVAQSPLPMSKSPLPTAQSPLPISQSPLPMSQSPLPQAVIFQTSRSPLPQEINPFTSQSPLLQETTLPTSQSPLPKDMKLTTQSPLPRDQSPLFASQSPIPQDYSPQPISQSPLLREQSPIPPSQSPILQSQSPLLQKEVPASPIPSAQSPVCGLKSPLREAESPFMEVGSPCRELQSPLLPTDSPLPDELLSKSPVPKSPSPLPTTDFPLCPSKSPLPTSPSPILQSHSPVPTSKSPLLQSPSPILQMPSPQPEMGSQSPLPTREFESPVEDVTSSVKDSPILAASPIEKLLEELHKDDIPLQKSDETCAINYAQELSDAVQETIVTETILPEESPSKLSLIEQIDTESVVTADVNSFLERSSLPEVQSPLSPNGDETRLLLEMENTNIPPSNLTITNQEILAQFDSCMPLDIDIKSEIISREYPVQTITTPSEESKTEDVTQNESIIAAPIMDDMSNIVAETTAVAAATTAAVAAATVAATAAVTQKKATAITKPKTSSTPTAKKSSPTKAAASPTKSATPSKPLPRTSLTKTTASTLMKTNQTKTTTAPTTTKTAAPKPLSKPKVPTATKTPAEKKLTNGDAKPSVAKKLPSSAAPGKPTAITKTVPSKLSPTKASVESKTTVGSMRPATAPIKTSTRPTSLAPKTNAPKTNLSTVNSTKSTTKTTTLQSPKSTTTTSAPRPRPATAPILARPKPTTNKPAPKTADAEKQIKETANKQITASHASTTSKTTGGKTTTMTVRKTELKGPVSRMTVTKTTTVKSINDIKKPAELIRHAASKTKTGLTKKPKPEQNGIVTEIHSTTVVTSSNIEQQLIKDVSPIVENVIDNSQIMETLTMTD